MKLLDYHWEQCSYSYLPIIMEVTLGFIKLLFVLDSLDRKLKL